MTDKLNIRAVLVDDSEQARKLLRLMLHELTEDVEVVAEASDVDSAVELIKKEKPDVVFLDIEMPHKSGLQLFLELPRDTIFYDVVFTTAYNNYALNAFRLSAIDYLLKPIQEDHLTDAVQRIRERKSDRLSNERLNALRLNLTKDSDPVMCLPVLSGYEYVKLNTVEFIEASGSYALIHLVDGKIKTISKNLKFIEQILSDESRFVRVHRSFIIHLDHMKSFSRSGRGVITMLSGAEIDLARDRRNDFFRLAGIA